MKRKKGYKGLVMCSQERAILKDILTTWLDDNKEKIKKNHLIKRDFTYVSKILGKLLRKKRCCYCGHWI